MALPSLNVTLSSATIEKREYILSSPIYPATPTAPGYPFAVRGYIFPRTAHFSCESETDPASRVGRYLIFVRWGDPQEHVGTYALQGIEAEKITIVFEGYFKVGVNDEGQPLTAVNDGLILRSSQKAIVDYQPVSEKCFGGKITVYLLGS